MARKSVIRKSILVANAWAEYNDRNFRSFIFYFPANGLAIDCFTADEYHGVSFRKLLKKLQGFSPTMRSENIEFACFKDQFSN